MKEEPLKLADEWDWMTEEKLAKWGDDAQAMIRRLVEELDKQTKPLNEKELYEVFDKCYPNNGDGDVVTLVDFARAIEERHGIK